MARHYAKPYEITCKQCGDSFRSAHPKALYCSECRDSKLTARGKTLKCYYKKLPPIRPAKVPTTATPGSKEKLQIMEERYRLRQELHHEEDRNNLLEAFNNVKGLTPNSL